MITCTIPGQEAFLLYMLSIALITPFISMPPMHNDIRWLLSERHVGIGVKGARQEHVPQPDVGSFVVLPAFTSSVSIERCCRDPQSQQ